MRWNGITASRAFTPLCGSATLMGARGAWLARSWQRLGAAAPGRVQVHVHEGATGPRRRVVGFNLRTAYGTVGAHQEGAMEGR